MYGFTGTPSVMFDGVTSMVGGMASGSMYASYLPVYTSRAATPSPVAIASSYTIMGDQCTVSTTVTVDLAMPGGTNQVQTYVALYDEHGHTNLVMAALATETITSTGIGQQTTVERTFTVDPAWDQANLRVVTLVQNMTSEQVLQAGLAAPDYRANIVVDCEPDGVAAGWTLSGPYGVLASGNGDKVLDAFYSGEFTLTWADVPYWTEPASGSQTQTVADGGQLVFHGTYTDGPFAAPTAAGGAADPSQGVSLVDFDGDGDLDAHLPIRGAADLLLRNDGGTYTSVGSGLIADAGNGVSSTWADFNGDGHLDVYIGRDGQANLLYAGDGAGNFSVVNSYGAGDAGQARSVSWVDYDNDDKLDLYVVNTGGANVLLKNMGDVGGGFWLFTFQSNGAGSTANGRTAAWADVDFDGRMDMYLVNSFAANQLLMNTTIGFSDVASTVGVADAGNGAGAAFGDYDNDGDWDLYLANDGSADRLYAGDGAGSFNLVLGTNLGDRGNARGVVFADLDNDTNLDLYVACAGQPDLLLIGDGHGNFARAPMGWSEAEAGGNGLACGDIDGDGDLDLFVAREGAQDVVFTNVMLQSNHWFEVRLHGTAGNPAGLGALVQVTSGGVTQMRQVTAGGYLGMSGGPAHFGLGAASTIDELRITWPNGTVQTAGPLFGDRVLDVTIGESIVSAVGDPVPATTNRLLAARPNPFNPSTSIAYELARAGAVRLEVFSVDGRRVAVLVDGMQAAGPHQAVWTGRDDAGRAMASGTYMYRLTAPDGEVLGGRMTLVK